MKGARTEELRAKRRRTRLAHAAHREQAAGDIRHAIGPVGDPLVAQRLQPRQARLDDLQMRPLPHETRVQRRREGAVIAGADRRERGLELPVESEPPALRRQEPLDAIADARAIVAYGLQLARQLPGIFGRRRWRVHDTPRFPLAGRPAQQ